MPTFDGINLIITLDSGVTEVDVITGIYEPWKDWLRETPINRGYPQAFVSDGGNPLSSIINQGSYIFLQNNVGWRVRPPEENITVYLTGNLAVANTLLPAFIPTIGAFTTAILGLQPVTQGVTPSMAAQLAFTSFQGAVCIDMSNASGNAVSGTGSVGSDNIGTRRAPSNNPDDALAIAVREGLNKINVASDFDSTGYSTDFSTGYDFVGDSPFVTLTMEAAANYTNCAVHELTVQGEADGVNLLEGCFIRDLTAFSGEMIKCDLDGDIGINGKARLMDCFSEREGAGYSRITSIGSYTVIVRNMRGSLGFAGMTGGTHSIGIGGGGRIVIEATCSGGDFYARGAPYEIAEIAGSSVNLVDQTGNIKEREIHTRLGLDSTKPLTNKDDGGITATGINIVATPSGTDIIQTRQ